jgi:hypothetical protein
MPTIDPQSYLPGIVKFTSESDGSGPGPAFFGDSQDYFAVPIEAVPNLEFADVDPITGDIRKFLFAWDAAILAAYSAIDAPDKPTMWVPSLGSNLLASGGILRTHSHLFETTVTGEQVANE